MSIRASNKRWIAALSAALMVCVCASASAQNYSLGDEADEVATIQTALKQLKLYSAGITGHYGEKTLHRLRQLVLLVFLRVFVLFLLRVGQRHSPLRHAQRRGSQAPAESDQARAVHRHDQRPLRQHHRGRGDELPAEERPLRRRHRGREDAGQDRRKGERHFVLFLFLLGSSSSSSGNAAANSSNGLYSSTAFGPDAVPPHLQQNLRRWAITTAL